jgi:hypothetical protein
MPVVSEASLRFAVRNVATHGDTDVFPFPIENRWFQDDEEVVLRLIGEIDAHFDTWVNNYPILSEKALGGVGYTGFRAATQIDPIWNAYLLALVVEIAADIEVARISPDRQIAFSYRFKADLTKATMFDPAIGWGAFHRSALEEAKAHPIVLTTDISDFYQRIYHHRLDNALKQASPNKDAVGRIMRLLFRLSARTSYGLPIGGPAARLLAELVLNRVDRLLLARGIRFKRFVDDYIIFAADRDEAQRNLAILSETLMINEGLSLSRLKTRLSSQSEFKRSSPLADPSESTSVDESRTRVFLKLRLAFDPYSPTAQEEYEHLASEIGKFDILGMLAKEFHKTRIDEALTRQLVKSIRFLDKSTRAHAVQTLLHNLKTLYPIFPSVVILLRAVMSDLSPQSKEDIFVAFRDLVRSESYIVYPSANLAYALRLLADDRSEETDALLIQIYGRAGLAQQIRRDVILAMAKRGVDYWLSETMKRYSTLGIWEKRALIVASYVLGDEGKHWRDGIKEELSEVDRAFMQWAGAKNNGVPWEIPL